MGYYVSRCNQILRNFYTTEPYGYEQEFGSKNLMSGSYMPLSPICVNLTVNHDLRIGGSSPWEKYYGVENSTYELNELGKLIYEFLRETDHLHHMGRTRIGSIGVNVYAKNERRRQVHRFDEYKYLYYAHRHSYSDEMRLKSETWRELEVMRKYCGELIDVDIKLIEMYLQRILRELQDIKTDRAWDRVMENIRHYISDQNKTSTSLMPGLNLSYPYLLKNEEPEGIVDAHIAIILETLNDLYSTRRVNPIINLNPLRQRPPDYSLISTTGSKARMSRSRKPLGVPHFSHIKICIYDVKKSIDEWITQEMLKSYGFSSSSINTPYTNDYFMWDFYRGKKGIYISGDNGSFIKSTTEKYNYDVSMSEAITAFCERDNSNRNFCFYTRLSNLYDTGASGDPITWFWNIKYQTKLWKAYKEGILQGKYFPEIYEIVEPSELFLGAWYNPVKHMSHNIGFRLTKDSAKDMIGYVFRVGENVIKWPTQHTVEDGAIMQTIVTSGISDISLELFYEWAFKNKITDEVKNVEDYSLYDVVGKVIQKAKEIDSFQDLFSGIDIEALAAPMTVDKVVLNH